MAATAPTTTPFGAEQREWRIGEHKDEVARLRGRLGDPEEALFAFVAARFGVRALVPDERPGRSADGVAGNMWDEDDEPDAR